MLTHQNIEKSDRLLYKVLAGSHSYGLNNEQSDRDYKGIYTIPLENYLSLEKRAEQISDEKNDIVYYDLKRFMELASQANPNIIELLFMPDHCLEFVSPEMEILLTNRQIFISKKCFDSHFRYAQAQIKKARGRNKWVNNPKEVAKPKLKDFCHLFPYNSEKPFRAISASEIDLNEFHCSSVEHIPNLYRLYHYGKKAKGVFSENQVICRSIPEEDETTKFWGTLHVNVPAFQHALKDHKNYWQWHKNRNQSRWQQQESGELDYDAKNMMHTFRLLYSGKNILDHGEPLVRFEGELQKFLMKIRQGQFTYDELITRADSLIVEMEKSFAQSTLPEEADIRAINQLTKQIYQQWQERTQK